MNMTSIWNIEGEG